MSVPYKGYKGNNLKDIIPVAIAFVNEGANKKPFFLFKRKDGKGMDKQKAIDLIKGGKLDEAEMDSIVLSVDESDREEVKKEAEKMKKSATSSEAVEKLVNLAVEKVGAKISKDVMNKINEISATLKGAVSKLEALGSKTEKVETKKDKDGKVIENPDEDLSDEQVADMIEKGMDTETKDEKKEEDN